jgi:hypothetical protein
MLKPETRALIAEIRALVKSVPPYKHVTKCALAAILDRYDPPAPPPPKPKRVRYQPGRHSKPRPPSTVRELAKAYLAANPPPPPDQQQVEAVPRFDGRDDVGGARVHSFAISMGRQQRPYWED